MLDFTIVKKTLDIQLPFGLIHVLPPKKKQIQIVGRLAKLSESLTTMDEDAIEEMYSCVADLMSNNTEDKKVATSDIDYCLDFSMIIQFVSEYAELMNGATAGKN